MLSNTLLARIVESDWFADRAAPYMVLGRDLRIRAVNAAYEAATGHHRERLVGKHVFHAFPDNPADPHADGVARLSHSLERVLSRDEEHWMGFQRYDVPDVIRPGEFTFKVWTPVNTPIRVNGQVVGALHHVQDVTSALGQDARRIASGHDLAELRAAHTQLMREFPDTPPELVLAVLTHSQRTVLHAAGSPRSDRAIDLARLRLEVRTGHPARQDPARDDPYTQHDD